MQKHHGNREAVAKQSDTNVFNTWYSRLTLSGATRSPSAFSGASLINQVAALRLCCTVSCATSCASTSGPGSADSKARSSFSFACLLLQLYEDFGKLVNCWCCCGQPVC